MLQLQEKRTFCSVLKVILNSKDASAVAGFRRNFVKVVGCVGDVAG